MAANGPMVVPISTQLVEIKARRRLKEEGSFEVLLQEVQDKLNEMTKSNPNMSPVISDLDISQNHVTPEQLETLLATIANCSVTVRRFRLFGIPTLNDEAMRILSEHLRSLTKDTAPTEMHLSDCAITNEGFYYLMNAIEEQELYPSGSAPGGKSTPLYLRLENNYIAEASLQEKAEAGVLRAFKKAGGNKRSVDPSSPIRVDLIVHDNGSWKQKTGDPPAPEDAPPPKQVHDKYDDPSRGRQATAAFAGNSWAQWGAAAAWPQWGAWGAQQWPAQQAQQARAAAPVASTPGATPAWQMPKPAGQQQQQPRPMVSPQAGVGAVGPARLQPPGAASPIRAWRPGMVGPAAVGKVVGNAAAVDRSRTPVGRTGGAGPGIGARPPPGPPPAADNSLPYPWEEHWSDEYNIPYFWNSETGDALWEKPSA